MNDEKSLKDKIGEMNGRALKICDEVFGQYRNNLDISENEIDEFAQIADGLTEEFITDRALGHCSLDEMDKWPLEKLEELVDEKIQLIKKIENNLTKVKEQ